MSNPAPGIKFLLDCCVQHLPLLQACPSPVLHAWQEVPQWLGSVLMLAQTPSGQTVAEQPQVVPEHVQPELQFAAPPHV